jgi:head-tail adaptor
MDASALRHRVNIMAQTQVADDGGGYARVWTATAEGVPATVKAVMGQADQVALQTGAVATHTVTMRYREDVPADGRIGWTEGQQYREAAVVGPLQADYVARSVRVRVREDTVRCRP